MMDLYLKGYNIQQIAKRTDHTWAYVKKHIKLLPEHIPTVKENLIKLHDEFDHVRWGSKKEIKINGLSKQLSNILVRYATTGSV